MRVIGLALFHALCLSAPMTGQTIREFPFEVETIGGQKLTHTDFENSVLLVDYWGTWCPPCRKAVPELQKLYAKYKHYGLEIVAFSYERGDPEQALDTLRTFASERGLTYHLAPGTPALRRLVPNFRGYPTLLFFQRGLVHDKTVVGFEPSEVPSIERWIREALELPVEPRPEPDDAEPRNDPQPQPADDAPEPLPPGVIFAPGDHDTGFDFTVEDSDGETIAFANLRDRPVLLVMTSTWDPEAEATAKAVTDLHERFGAERAHVLAASLELPKRRAGKVAAIRRFKTEHELPYRVFPADLAFQKKIHQWSGMPTYLVFDGEGRLTLRETGNSKETLEKVATALGGE